jgi:biopolymer transport protein ExbD
MRTLTKPELNASSMADVAFLMLSFFMITTQISNEQGLPLLLPTLAIQPPAPANSRNMFAIHINSMDQYMVRGERRSGLAGLRYEIKEFIINNRQRPDFSDNPEKAIVSLKADRGTSHQAFIHALDEIQAAYYELYASQAGISVIQFRNLDLRNGTDRVLYEKGKRGIPMNISIAEPSKAGN